MPYEPTWYRYSYTGSLPSVPNELLVYGVNRTPLDSQDIVDFVTDLDFP